MIIYSFCDDDDNEHSIVIKDEGKSEYFPKWRAIIKEFSSITGELTIKKLGELYGYKFTASNYGEEAVIDSDYLYSRPLDAMIAFEEDYPWIEF